MQACRKQFSVGHIGTVEAQYARLKRASYGGLQACPPPPPPPPPPTQNFTPPEIISGAITSRFQNCCQTYIARLSILLVLQPPHLPLLLLQPGYDCTKEDPRSSMVLHAPCSDLLEVTVWPSSYDSTDSIPTSHHLHVYSKHFSPGNRVSLPAKQVLSWFLPNANVLQK